MRRSSVHVAALPRGTRDRRKVALFHAIEKCYSM